MAAVAELGDERAAAITADLSDSTAGSRLVQAAFDRFGNLHGTLISVGGPPVGTVMQTSDQDWQRAVDAVLLGSLRVARAVAGERLARGEGGSIAFVTPPPPTSPVRF